MKEKEAFVSRKILLAMAMSAALLAAQSNAQEQGGPGVKGNNPPAETGNVDEIIPNVFGVQDEDIYTVSWSDLRPHSSAVGYTSDTGTVTGGYRWTTSGADFLNHGVEGIDNGAVITQVAWYVLDNHAANNFTGYLCRYWRDSNFGGNPGGDCISTVSSAGSPGVTAIADNITHTVRRRTPMAATPQVINYVLFTETPGFDGTIKFGQARILWRRQISPAPGAATFLDVPLGHPQRQFVEALVAAGITVGCGGGNYCPNDPVTRGQMAVFLARLVGLHWPAF